MAEVECPFCGFKSTSGELMVQLHIEQYHTEDSPFVVRDETAAEIVAPAYQNDTTSTHDSMPNDTWTKCTRQGCGQDVPLTDVDEHLRLHEVEAMTGDVDQPEKVQSPRGSPGKAPRQTTARPSSRQHSTRTAPISPSTRSPKKQSQSTAHTLLNYFSGTSHMGRPPPRAAPPRRIVREPLQPGRLGKRELGPQAFERAMPARVRQCLENDARPQQVNRIGRDGRLQRETFVVNETSRLIHSISDLCALDPSTEATYLCDPNTKHVVRLDCEGNFCGYWNIQMMLSHIRGRQYEGRGELQVVPNILQIQDTIEQAWDNGICSYGRIETGGVRGTRKWIGTHETVAYFTQIGVRVEALCFKDEEIRDNFQSAVLSLLDHVEAYFMSGLQGCSVHQTSHVTKMSPIYFQRFGHSMTIVGLERKRDGSRNLLVFDPSFATSKAMKRLLAGLTSYASPQQMLRAYRRSEVSLSAWGEFEIVVPQPYSETITEVNGKMDKE